MRSVFTFCICFALSVLSAAELVNIDFAKHPRMNSICEGNTVIHYHKNSLVLGGPSKTGEKSGFRLNAGKFSDFELEVRNLRWSHPHAMGGHQTEILLLNDLQQGFVLAFAAGDLTVFRQDAPGKRAEITKFPKLWNSGKDMTVKRMLKLSRKGAVWEIALTGVEKPMRFEGAQYPQLNSFSMTYRVFIHGYACWLDGIKLTVPDAAEKGAKALFFDPWRQSDSPIARSVKAFQTAGLPVDKYDGELYKLTPGQGKTLILPSSALSDDDLRGVLDYLRNGGKVILWGSPEWNFDTPAGHRFQERILGAAAPRPRESFNLRFVSDVKGTVPQEKNLLLSLLPLNNTIEKQTLEAGVQTVELALADYRAKNWIQRPDVFTGTPLQLTIHHSGEFAGAKVIFAGFSGEMLSAELLKELLDVLKKEYPAKNAFTGARELTRENFFNYPGMVAGPLCFRGYDYLDDPIFDEDMRNAGFQFAMYCIPWLYEEKDGEVVDWERLEEIVSKMRAKGLKVMLDPYPFNFNAKSFKWLIGKDLAYSPAVEPVWLNAIAKVARRYKDDPTVVAMWCSPFTHTGDFIVGKTPEMRRLWADYLKNVKKYSLAEINKRYGLALKSFDELPFPQEDKSKPYNIGPEWSDYLDFHIYTYQEFLRKSIRAIRKEVPEMPLAIRCAYMDPAPAMAAAAEFPNVSAHIECIETSVDTEGYFRSLALNFNIPVTAENGWPKASPAAMKAAFADLMLGNYPVFLYSFGGPRWLRRNYPEFRRYAVIRQEMAQAKYVKPEVGLVLPDTTLYGGRPANFFAVEKLPALVLTMERSGVAFAGVSSCLPELKGMDVLLDAGNNRIYTRKSLEKFKRFVSTGGTFITFVTSGKYAFDGGKDFFATLNIPRRSGVFKIGKGKVVVLDDVKNYQDHAKLAALLAKYGAKPYVKLNAPVCNALFADGKRKYLVLHNKNRKMVGSYFTESIHNKTVNSQKPLALEVEPQFAFQRVRLLPEKKELPVSDGKIKFTLHPTDTAVLLFE
ncbi:MAG: beta-galactosidase [Lentisphaeria bacterium]|nr:beta-galactosidase [Lentisphaeria bacterium]